MYANVLCVALSVENDCLVMQLSPSSVRRKWMELCELAAKEKDSAKLFTLVREISRLLLPIPNPHKFSA